MERYFVVIFARDAGMLRALQRFELDVFPPTSKRTDRDKDYPYSIDGLLTLAEVETVVKAGYRVLIEDPAAKRARGAESVKEFPEWLEEMQATMTRARTAGRTRRGAGKK